MTAMDLPADDAPASRRRPPRVPLPASRRGVAWLVVLVIVGIFLAVQFGRQVYANWDIGRRAEAIQAQIAEVEEQNAQLQAELDYLQSDAYVSAEARRLANLGDPGEQVLIIPPGAEQPVPQQVTAAEAPRPMLQQWLELFFGASS